MKFCCDYFEKNVRELNGCITMADIHGGGLSDKYIPFKYCPWCGKELAEDKPFVGDSDHEHDDRIL
jgi:hypothetical protein